VSCTDARRLVSERLDGLASEGLDEHLAACGSCRAFLDSAEDLRRGIRFEAVGAVPDIATVVRAHLAADPPTAAPLRSGYSYPNQGADRSTRNEAVERRRGRRSVVAVAAAALVAGVLIGVNLVGVGEDGPRPVAAQALPARVAAAQARIDGLQAELRLTERGWNPAVPERRYTGSLHYRAPESLALSWRDTTAYPSGAWRPNDVDLRTDGATWVATGVPDCPSVAQPECSSAPREQTVSGRPPFADDAPVPLDLVVPVRSFPDQDIAEVAGEGTVAGRPTVEVTVVAAQVAPLLEGLAPAGNLRAVHPTDEVELSLDAADMVPLRLRVLASSDPGRRAWAVQRGYADRPGLAILEMEVTALRLAPPVADGFAPPAGTVAGDAGFRPGPTGLDLAPAVPDGFTLGRVGRIDGPTPTAVWSWSDGRAWIRLQATDAWSGARLFGDLGPLVRPVRVGAVDAFVSPDGRQVGWHGDDLDLVVDGSVGTDTLLAVAAATGVPSVALPTAWPEVRSASPAVIRRSVPGALSLDVDGFEAPAGRVDGPTAVQFTAGAGDRRLLLAQTPGGRIAQPTEQVYESVRVRGVDARYAPGPNRLEWVESGLVVTLEGTGLDRAELLAMAEGLALR